MKSTCVTLELTQDLKSMLLHSPAALTVYEIATKLEIEIVINPGTAGGFKSRGGKIGIYT